MLVWMPFRQSPAPGRAAAETASPVSTAEGRRHHREEQAAPGEARSQCKPPQSTWASGARQADQAIRFE
eukprot:47078-Pyramimonas_sp.AAC.1